MANWKYSEALRPAGEAGLVRAGRRDRVGKTGEDEAEWRSTHLVQLIRGQQCLAMVAKASQFI